jgi:hypothetical protein
MENINSTWSEVTTKMYEQTDVNEEKKDDMEDVEFEEVK